MSAPARILVIRLSALGNVVQSLGAFAAIRRHHPRAHITLLTTAPFASWLAGSPYFDAVWTDERPDWWDLPGLLRLRARLRAGCFERVYDLQTSARSSRYFRLFPRHARPEWSGIARGCSHPDADRGRDRLHDLDRQAGQLRAAGIAEVPPPDLSWTGGDATRFRLRSPYALLVPGSSPHRPGKRWPAAGYAALAAALADEGLRQVVIGGAAERRIAETIARAAPVTDLTGQTSLGDLASLARGAALAVGNDTGPMHLIAAAGCPSLVLFSGESDPALCAPRGPRVVILRQAPLAALLPGVVIAAALELRRPQPQAASDGD
ncbi:MAG TPA: glycosyltransferase family 9 protein [Acetobacteraceae bacterium]|nr:glycosyltransferase family 9 protein [Acetobacteraceae bacterium]